MNEELLPKTSRARLARRQLRVIGSRESILKKTPRADPIRMRLL